MNRLVLVLLHVTMLLPIIQYAQTDIFAINKKLGRGVNMGNIFEAPAEGEWGNPFRADYFKKIKDLGFNHVRIPIRWDTPLRTNQIAPYTISQSFKDRIKEVVDLALKENLLVIINMHHHDEIFSNPTATKPRFLAQWKQIGELFKGYNNDLLFEVMNEPHDNLTPELWNIYFADALAVIRDQNPQRAVVMGTAQYGGLGGLSALRVPADGKIIVSIHYYNPFNFTHQGAEWVSNSDPWLGTTWNDTEIEREVVRSELFPLIQFGNANKVPIHIGEFGAYSKADIKSRVRWSTFLARYIESLGFSWAYWEWSAGFGMFNPATNSYNQDLVNALLKNPLPTATHTTLTPIYCSNFSQSNDLGVFAQGGAAVSSNISNGILNINITNKGTEGWHVQGTKNNINMVNGKTYRLSFEMKSPNNHSITYYVGKNSNPYNSYSGYNTANTTTEYKTYSTVFKMTDQSDPQARIAMDMATAVGNIQIKSICLEEVSLVFTPTVNIENLIAYTIKPNPVYDYLQVENLLLDDKIKVYDLRGVQIYDKTVDDKTHNIPTMTWPQGQYIIDVHRNNKHQLLNFIKQ